MFPESLTKCLQGQSVVQLLAYDYLSCEFTLCLSVCLTVDLSLLLRGMMVGSAKIIRDFIYGC